MVTTYAVVLLSWLWLLAPEAKAARSYEVELLIFEHHHQDDDESLIPQFNESVTTGDGTHVTARPNGFTQIFPRR